MGLGRYDGRDKGYVNLGWKVSPAIDMIYVMLLFGLDILQLEFQSQHFLKTNPRSC